MYILLLISAMTVGITVIKQSFEGCEAAHNLDGNQEPQQVTLAAQC